MAALQEKAIPVILHTPETNNARASIFPITESDNVLMSDNMNETLTQRLGGSVTMSPKSSTPPNGPCLWLQTV